MQILGGEAPVVWGEIEHFGGEASPALPPLDEILEVPRDSASRQRNERAVVAQRVLMTIVTYCMHMEYVTIVINTLHHCKNRSVLSTLIFPNTHTKTVLVCVLGQISVLNTLLFLQSV